MVIQQAIEDKLSQRFKGAFIQVENESHQHSVPENSETHFKVVVVSDEFDGLTLIKRHRLINELLAEQLAGPVHALAMHTYTPKQWSDKNQLAPDSAKCLGGSK